MGTKIETIETSISLIIEKEPSVSWEDVKDDLNKMGIIYNNKYAIKTIKTNDGEFIVLGDCTTSGIYFPKHNGLYSRAFKKDAATNLISLLEESMKEPEEMRLKREVVETICNTFDYNYKIHDNGVVVIDDGFMNHLPTIDITGVSECGHIEYESIDHMLIAWLPELENGAGLYAHEIEVIETYVRIPFGTKIMYFTSDGHKIPCFCGYFNEDDGTYNIFNGWDLCRVPRNDIKICDWKEGVRFV